jgi:hypothetical protein
MPRMSYALKTLIRLLASLLLLLSAARSDEEIVVEPGTDGVIVRSPIAAANFLFRAPADFKRATPAEGFAVSLAADGQGGKGTIALRLGELSTTEARAGLDAFVQAHEEEYRKGLGGTPGITGGRGRRTVVVEGKDGLRIVLVVFDGARHYELFLDAQPPDSALALALPPVAEGFTILDPKGAPEGAPPTGDAKAGTIEHDYYRLKLHKPAGFLQQEVDPDQDKGIFLQLRREDEAKNRCDIYVRVFLAKALKEQVDAMAQRRIDEFRSQHDTPKGPERAVRTRMPGSNAAFRFKEVGKSAHGQVVEEEWLLVDHENGRVYEFEVACYGAAARAFKKDIDAFWKGIHFKE